MQLFENFEVVNIAVALGICANQPDHGRQLLFSGLSALLLGKEKVNAAAEHPTQVAH